MICRRDFLGLSFGFPSLQWSKWALAQATDDSVITVFDYPPIPKHNYQPFGSFPASRAQRQKAAEIFENAPTGPNPISVARYFIDTYKNNPHLISAWPANDAWNPLIVEFFSVTPYPVNQDTVPWCAAFLNWCLRRSHRPDTGRAGSQSFYYTKLFEQTDAPSYGDIVVYSCYDLQGKHLDAGHVTFYNHHIDDKHILCTGGNQSGTPGKISDTRLRTDNFNTTRHINGVLLPVQYRLTRYLRVV